MKIETRSLPPASHDPKAAPVAPVTPVQVRPNARFEALLGQREANRRRSLRAELEQACASEPVNPELFSGPRALDTLQFLLDEVLPELDADPDIRDLAQDLLREEIDLRRTLEQQRAEGQDA